VTASGTLRRTLIWLALAIVAAAPLANNAAPPKSPTCQRVTLTGEVQSGQEWHSSFGQGWIFRVVPVQPGKGGYSGWDLVVDREEGAGYPDALLVATPPYYSISEREVATTFKLRAQDAIGWNPRSFHFLTDPAALHESQKLFRNLGPPRIWTEKSEPDSRQQSATQALQQINQKSSPGEFRILNARLTPGTADAAPFAQRWAIQSSRTPHKIVPLSGASSTALGELQWMRFSINLWLPRAWKLPKGLQAAPAACSQ